MGRSYRITMTAEQLATLRKLASAHAPDLAATFDRALGARAEEPGAEGDEDEDGRVDEIEEGTAAAMSAIAGGALETGDPDEALADAAASVEAADDDKELPAAKRGRRTSPLALWAGTKGEDERPNDGHPGRLARSRR